MGAGKEIERIQMELNRRSKKLIRQRNIVKNAHQIAQIAMVNNVKCIRVYERRGLTEAYKFQIHNGEMVIEMPAAIAQRTITLLKGRLKNSGCCIIYEKKSINEYSRTRCFKTMKIQKNKNTDDTDDGSGTGKRHGRINI